MRLYIQVIKCTHVTNSDVPDIVCEIKYVGSAYSESHDQILNRVLVGPVPSGKHNFEFEVLKVFTLHVHSVIFMVYRSITVTQGRRSDVNGFSQNQFNSVHASS